MYRIIDSCYGQNFGAQDFPTDMEIISRVLAEEGQLQKWEKELFPLYSLHILKVPMTIQDLDKMSPNDLITERFNCVLSLRFHNLRILLHRPFLEKLLDSYNSSDINTESAEKQMLQQLGINSVQTCINSAMVIISIVHTVVNSTGWRRDLLGAWNYSLFYSKSVSSLSHRVHLREKTNSSKRSMPASLYLEPC